MSDNYHLLYLPIRGRAECLVLMMHHLGIPFTDGRFDPEYAWPKVKNSTPFGKGPVLVVNGDFHIAHTTIIMRYLAKKHNFMLGDEKQDLLVDIYGEQIQDYIVATIPWGTEYMSGKTPSPESRKCLETMIMESFGPFYEKQLKKNGTGYIVGNKVAKAGEWLENFPLIIKHQDMVFNLPTIQQYLKTRLETNF